MRHRRLRCLHAELMGRTLYIDAATSGAEAKARAAKPVEGCWFCLSNPNADVELVASVGARPAAACAPARLAALCRCYRRLAWCSRPLAFSCQFFF